VFGRRITLFRMLGFAVRADLSWFIIVILVTWSLATAVFPQLYEGLETRAYWLMAAAGALVLFLSIIIHELSHSLVARRYGIPMKGITLFIFGGVAEMDDEPQTPKAELLMAVAGPVASVVIAVAFIAIAAAGAFLGWRREILGVFQYVGVTNLILAVFNMLPAFPLDGGRVLRSLLWWRTGNLKRSTRIASRAGSSFGLLMILVAFYRLFSGDLIGGLWWFLIGTFLRNVAAMSYQQVLFREYLAGQPVSRFMNPEPITVPRSISIAELVEDYIYRYHHKMFPVVDGERLVGCITTSEVKKLPREEWQAQTVGAVARPCQEIGTIEPDADAVQALTRMGRSGASRLLVVEDDRLAGILTLKDLLQFLSVKLDLEGDQPAVRT
jgi:Zn-dependent protease/CBS domain-containing protein